MKEYEDPPTVEPRVLDRAAAAIRAGRLVVFPTETVYGLGADALRGDAVARVFAAKRRPADNPLIVHLADRGQIESVATDVPPAAIALFERFAPGPLTIVLPARADLPRVVTAGLSTVAVRFPAHPVAQQLLRACGRPLAAPSANRSGEPSPTTVEMARASLGAAVDVYLDGGPCSVGLESTVVLVRGTRALILRPGAVTAERMREAVDGLEVDFAAAGPSERPASPGMKHHHYRPRARVLIAEPRELASRPQAGERASVLDEGGLVAVVGLRETVREAIARLERRGGPLLVREAADAGEYARNLYRWFTEADAAGAVAIVAILPPEQGIGRALRDRLERASGGESVAGP